MPARVRLPTLQQLEDEGLVTSEQAEGRRTYRLTDAGRDELKQSRPHTVRSLGSRAILGRLGAMDGARWRMVAGTCRSVMKAAMRAATRGAR